jgi:hypothetical protein
MLVITEAKQNNFTEGWGQCLAELLAAQKINRDNTLPVHGIVTDGELWQFGKLENDVFTKNKTGLTIDNIDKIFGAIAYLIDKHFESSEIHRNNSYKEAQTIVKKYIPADSNLADELINDRAKEAL